MFASSEDDAYFARLTQHLSNTHNDEELFKSIVDCPFSDKKHTDLLDLGILMLFLVNKENHTIERTGLSDSGFAKPKGRVPLRLFKEISIPYDFKGNLVAEAIRSERYQQTSEWQHLFAPSFTPEEAEKLQTGTAIECSFVFPLINARAGGVLVFNYYLALGKIQREHHDFMYRYSKLVAKRLNA